MTWMSLKNISFKEARHNKPYIVWFHFQKMSIKDKLYGQKLVFAWRQGVEVGKDMGINSKCEAEIILGDKNVKVIYGDDYTTC